MDPSLFEHPGFQPPLQVATVLLLGWLLEERFRQEPDPDAAALRLVERFGAMLQPGSELLGPELQRPVVVFVQKLVEQAAATIVTERSRPAGPPSA